MTAPYLRAQTSQTPYLVFPERGTSTVLVLTSQTLLDTSVQSTGSCPCFPTSVKVFNGEAIDENDGIKLWTSPNRPS